MRLNFAFDVTVCFQGAESNESNKNNADETSNVIEALTSEGKKTKTSCEEEMDYQHHRKIDETGPGSFEFLGLPEEQKGTEEPMDTSDDTVVVRYEDVPSKTYFFHSQGTLSWNGKQTQQIARNNT